MDQAARRSGSLSEEFRFYMIKDNHTKKYKPKCPAVEHILSIWGFQIINFRIKRNETKSDFNLDSLVADKKGQQKKKMFYKKVSLQQR